MEHGLVVAILPHCKLSVNCATRPLQVPQGVMAPLGAQCIMRDLATDLNNQVLPAPRKDGGKHHGHPHLSRPIASVHIHDGYKVANPIHQEGPDTCWTIAIKVCQQRVATQQNMAMVMMCIPGGIPRCCYTYLNIVNALLQQVKLDFQAFSSLHRMFCDTSCCCVITLQVEHPTNHLALE